MSLRYLKAREPPCRRLPWEAIPDRLIFRRFFRDAGEKAVGGLDDYESIVSKCQQEDASASR